MMKMMEGQARPVDYEVVHDVLSMGITLRSISRPTPVHARNGEISVH